MQKSSMRGVYPAQKKDGTIYYRSSITYKTRHISLGSYRTELSAHLAYLEADRLLHTAILPLPENYPSRLTLSFDKWLSLLNFRENHLYIKNPIFLKKDCFLYYLKPDLPLIFDIDDLFYFSEHKIMQRNGHLFVADYGMQISILSRYGIKNYAVCDRDYLFKNGNHHDFRYSNIEIINPYNGVRRIERNNQILYEARILIRGSVIIGRYSSPEDAAIAYNKAIDVLKKAGSQKNYQPNYIEGLSGKEYAERYSRLHISPKLTR